MFHLLVTVNPNVHYPMIKLINTHSLSSFIKLACFAPDLFHVSLRIHLPLQVSGFSKRSTRVPYLGFECMLCDMTTVKQH